MGEGIEAREGKEKGMIVTETENGYLAYQVKSSIIIGLPKDCRKLTDAELTTLVLLVEKWMEEGEQND